MGGFLEEGLVGICSEQVLHNEVKGVCGEQVCPWASLSCSWEPE